MQLAHVCQAVPVGIHRQCFTVLTLSFGKPFAEYMAACSTLVFHNVYDFFSGGVSTSYHVPGILFRSEQVTSRL